MPPLLIGLVALVARLHALGAKPYWLDEITTLRRSSLALGPLMRDSLSFHHMPLYFVLTSWLVPFGLGEDVMRLPAALFGAASCVVLFLLGRTLGGWRSGMLAALLLALAPFQVQYGQEARSYTLVLTLILLGLWGLVLLAGDPVAAARPLHTPGRARTAWLLYGLGTALALDTLGVALFWLLAANIGAFLIIVRAPRPPRGFGRNWMLVQAAILAAFLPFLGGMAVLNGGDFRSGMDWVPPLDARNVWDTLQTVYLLRISSLIAFRLFPSPLDLFGVGWLGWLVLLLALAGLVSSMRRGPVGIVVAVGLFTLPVGLATASLLFPLWMPRYLLWSGPVFFLLAGLGLRQLPVHTRDPALVLLTALAVVNLLPYYRVETKPLWKEAAAAVLHGWRPGDTVVTDNPATVAMMNVYLGRSGHRLNSGDWTTDVAAARARLAAGARVLAVHGTVGQNDPYRLAHFLGSLTPLGPASSKRRVGIDITILLFTPTPG